VEWSEEEGGEMKLAAGDVVAAVPPSLKDEGTRNVFSLVVGERRVRLKDLQDRLQLNRDEARNSLESLTRDNLIQKQPAPLEDFSLYYVTAQGLELAHELRRTSIL
jgi:predicted transcriptional regulator